MSELLLVEDQGAVRVLTLNRPEKLNALNTALTQALVDGLRAADQAAHVHVVVLTGAGRAFCAGADTSEFKSLTPAHAERVAARSQLTMQSHLLFSQMHTPVISAVRGAAMGGGAGLALAADICIASDTLKLGYPEIQHGILPAIVLTNLTRQIGRKAAFELVARGQSIGADRALALGAINRVVADAQLMQEALTLAQELAAHPPDALFALKRLFYSVVDQPLAAGLELGRKANIEMRAAHSG